MSRTIPRLLGRSHDWRTNRWSVKCPKCGHEFEPMTTLFATQRLSCPKPKCGAEMVAHYNEDYVELVK